MVPELGGSAAAELTDLTSAVRAAAATLPSHWVAIGVGRQDQCVTSDAVGTFAGYGVDLPVTLRPGVRGPVGDLPLCALITGWLRAQANPSAIAEVRVFADDLTPEAAVQRGRELRDELAGRAAGVLVVADGAHTLTAAAPGGYDPDSVAVQQHWDDALATGDVDAVATSDGVLGRVAYQVLAGFAGSDPSAAELYRGAPYGVGYFVGTWTTR